MKNNLFPPGSLVFDIGANVGQSSRQFIEWGAGQVVAVEPCLANFLKLLQVPNIVPIHAACWCDADLVPITPCINQDGFASILPSRWSLMYPDCAWGQTELVAALTLDQLIARFPDPAFIKIDCEGSDLAVLKGLDVKVPVLAFEFTILDDAISSIARSRNLAFTHGTYITDDIKNPELNLDIPLDELERRFLEDKPKWGNFILR